ncbi:MAG TPA: cytidine deaminase [Myxococcales bacterium]|nr:cytidine deaminase [Myxococcales bacterium]
MEGPRSRLPALLRAAARARARAYAPYSGFAVGAAVLAGGRIYAGANVENSAYPLSACAERNAVALAAFAGHRRIEAAAVVGGEGRPAAPCGGCRQVLAEFCAADAPIAYASSKGRSVTTTLGALLPDSFGPADLLKAAAEGSRSSSKGPPGRRRSAARGRGTRGSGPPRSR